jgi:hypothetical protein
MLDNIDKKKNPFKIPENYFENFNAGIMGKLPEKQAKKAKIVPLWKKALPWTAAAAILCRVIFTPGVLKENNKSVKPAASITSGSTSSVDEDDYYGFLEDEVAKAYRYDGLYYSN